MKLKICENLRTSSLNSIFTGSCIKQCRFQGHTAGFGGNILYVFFFVLVHYEKIM